MGQANSSEGKKKVLGSHFGFERVVKHWIKPFNDDADCLALA